MYHSHKVLLTQQIRKRLGTDKNMRSDAAELVKVFIREYEKTFQEVLPTNRTVATTYMKRALIWCSGNPDELKKVILFLIGDWDRVKSSMNLVGKPSIRLIGSADLFNSIRAFQQSGVATVGTKARFSEDSSPSVGW